MHLECSDKLGKWALLGWQGALLASVLAGPLRFASISLPFADDGAFSKAAAAMQRACYDRFGSAWQEATQALQAICGSGIDDGAPVCHKAVSWLAAWSSGPPKVCPCRRSCLALRQSSSFVSGCVNEMSLCFADMGLGGAKLRCRCQSSW